MFKVAYEQRIFKDSALSLDEYAELVTGYVRFCVDISIPVWSIHSYSHQKPWINDDIRLGLRECTTAFKLGDKKSYNPAVTYGESSKALKDNTGGNNYSDCD